MTERSTQLSAFDIGCVVVGGILGVGIFFTPKQVALAVDSPGQALAAWALGGLLAALGALVFAELSLRVPGHGGVFRYLEAAFGRTVAFLYGWANWLVIQAGALGVVALVLVDHLQIAVGADAAWSSHVRTALAALLMLTFTVVNVFGLRTGKWLQNTLIVLKLVALSALVLVALWAAANGPPAPPAPPSGRPLPAMLAAAMLPVLFATGGWQQGSFVAGAARRRGSVPLGILGGVLVVVVVYLAINHAYLSLLGFERARQSPAIGAAAAEVALGAGGARVLAGLVVLSAAGILNTICMAPPYVLYAMAQQGCFPAAFGHLHPRYGTPVLGVLGQGLWAVVLLGTVHALVEVGGLGSTVDSLDFVCNGVVFVDWLGYGAVGVALLVLRRRGDPGSVRLPLAGAAARLFVLGAAAVAVGACWTRPLASAVGAVLVAVGLLARRWWR
jgi:APA family basic amino acid/polyamine antiporter